MTLHQVDLLPEAIQELEEAQLWYLVRSRPAASGFLREVDKGLRLIAEAPRVWPMFEGNTRRYLLARYPFSLIYRETQGTLQLVAVMHHKRRPGYWRNR